MREAAILPWLDQYQVGDHLRSSIKCASVTLAILRGLRIICYSYCSRCMLLQKLCSKYLLICITLQRPFTCSVDDCHSSYRRKDHLTGHMLQHQGKLFECTVEGCKRTFTYQGNMRRHVKEFHDECASDDINHPLEHACLEPGCGKTFKYLSRLQKHENSHGKILLFWFLCKQVIFWWNRTFLIGWLLGLMQLSWILWRHSALNQAVWNTSPTCGAWTSISGLAINTLHVMNVARSS